MNRDRFKDAPWFDLASMSTVSIGGAGGISSWLALFIVRAGLKIIIYDHDTYESSNAGGQFMKISDIDKPKVLALKENIELFCGSERYNQVQAMFKKFDNDSMVSVFMLSGFDKMEPRKIMFDKWYANYKNNSNAILIDGRLTFEQIQIFSVTPDKAEEYASKHLFADEEVPDAACTLKQTSHTAAMTAAFMTSILTNHFTNIYTGKPTRNVPFEFEYFIPLMLQT